MSEWLPHGWHPRRVLVVDRHRALGDLLFVTAVLRRMRQEWPEAELVLIQAESPAARAVRIDGLADAVWLADDVEHPGGAQLATWLGGKTFDLAWLTFVDDPASDAWIDFAAARSGRLAVYAASGRGGREIVQRGNCVVRIAHSGTTTHRRDQLMASVFDTADAAPEPHLTIEPGAAACAAKLREEILARTGARGLAVFVPAVGGWFPQRRVPRTVMQAAARAAAEHGLAVAFDSFELRGEDTIAGATSLPPLPLPLLLALIAAADLAVSGDTGPAHAAVSLGIPNVTIFGPTSRAMHGHRPGDRGADIDAVSCPFGIDGNADASACATHCRPGAACCFAPPERAADAVARVLGARGAGG